MAVLFSTSCFAAAALYLMAAGQIEPASLLWVLALGASEIVRFRFYSKLPLLLIQSLMLFMAIDANPAMVYLLPVVLQSLASQGQWLLLAGTVVVVAPWQFGMEPAALLIMLAAGVVIGSLHRQGEQGRKSYEAVYDNERRLRYELEGTKNRLLQSLHEQVQLAEAHERSRIARDIHDHVGHGLAGVLMQLQAAKKILGRDPAKAEHLLQNSIERLAESVTIMRETVHNLRPKAKLGAEYLEKIVESFQFCPISWKSSGDLAAIPGPLLELVGVIIKEALTNAHRHSQATEVTVQVDVYERFVRIMVADNGNGVVGTIREGMGLSGIRERVQNLGGSVSIQGQDGFMVVCILPLVSAGREAKDVT